MEEEERKVVEKVLKSQDLRPHIDDLWVCILKHGDPLFEGRMALGLWMGFVRDAGLVKRGWQAQVDEEQYKESFQKVAQEAGSVDFTGFVSALFNAAMYRHNTTERIPALKVLMDHYAKAYPQRVREENVHDGFQAGEVLAEALKPDGFIMIHSLDRVLYKYNKVLVKLHAKYKGAYPHTRKVEVLGAEAVEGMQATMEAEDMRELLKDFGLFPSVTTMLDICRIVHFSAFGTEPTFSRYQPADKPDKEDPASPSSGAPSTPVTPFSGVKSEEEKTLLALKRTTDMAGDVYFADDTPGLDLSQFTDALIRLAQLLYQSEQGLPTVTSRVENLLRKLVPQYPTLMGCEMQADMQFEPKDVPILHEASPKTGPCAGGFDVTLTGHNFCDIRGVYVKFADSRGEHIVKTTTVELETVTVQVPPVVPKGSRVDMAKEDACFAVQLFKEASLTITASNDRSAYSSTNPPLVLVLEDPSPAFMLPDDLVDKLGRLFSKYCSSDDRYNTTRLTRDKWNRFKQEYKLRVPGGGMVNETDPAGNVAKEEDPYFAEAATQGEGDKEQEPHMLWEPFLKTVIKIFAQEPEAGGHQIVESLRKIVQAGSDKYVGMGLHGQSSHEEEEMKMARAGIKLIQRGTTRTLDIYCGPVLCGTIQERPGLITTFSSQTKAKHKFLTYQQHDINTESRIRNHIAMAESFDHLLNRLLLDSFELAASCEPKSRKPTGRCWTIHHGKEKIGALWDYEGQMSNLDWQPAQVETTNTAITLTVYRADHDPHYVLCYICFIKAKDVSHMRTMLTAKGYSLQTLLYKL